MDIKNIEIHKMNLKIINRHDLFNILQVEKIKKTMKIIGHETCDFT